MVALSGATFAQNKVFSVTTSPAENTRKGMNISWATDKTISAATVEIAKANDTEWKNSRKEVFNGEYCTTFDNQYSKLPDGKNFYEDVKINKYNAPVNQLKREKQAHTCSSWDRDFEVVPIIETIISIDTPTEKGGGDNE